MDKTNKWNKELELLHTIILKAPLMETRKWGGPVFTYNGKNVISYAGFKNHFALWFFNGSHLPDTANVLTATQGEKTKNLRQWRFTNREQIDEKMILKYIDEAIQTENAGLRPKPGKKAYIPIPEILQAALTENKSFGEAFSRLSAAKQNEYNEYIEEAKQEKTKYTRIEKIRHIILEGKGLNDKYK
ncbi:YdeI/OmpD-associated family protein [Sphingobacterium sp. SYP-B4668]|uniref:YdeI/OmpD-associated family protein n=1 Tax=Sphingobacterium sp. SYP-B4668 TaxID=2996035 RepID=UPI0022DE924C|nr:DUF1801 domain-containing protein [Sphingobacterium sp. SYP-B4668]